MASVAATRWVLVTDHGYSQSRTTLVTVRALSVAGYRPAVTYSDRWSIAVASRHAERRVRLQGAGYAEAVRRELGAHDYLAVLPTSDIAVLSLGASGADLLDKRSLASAAARVGFATPPTLEYAGPAQLFQSAAGLDYPVVVKAPLPRFRPFRAVGPEDLRLVGGIDCPLLVQPYIPDRLRAVSGVMWAGQLVAVSHQRYARTWPPDCGGASVAETSSPDLELEERLAALLAAHQGLFMAQFAGTHLLDLNPRPYGSLPLAVAAGANLPALYADLLRGREPPARPVRSRPGVRYRWLEGDIRALIQGVRRGSMSPAEAMRQFLPRANPGATVETWRDPLPACVRLAYAMSHRRRARRPC
jgi:ATP-grasp in the biosynthetic pathway with Ter operon